MYGVFVFIILADVTVLTVAQAPLWTSPSTTSLVLDTRDSQACDSVTLLNAKSGNSQSVELSLVSQVPDGNFTIGFDDFSGESVLQCYLPSITEAQYTVSSRAHYDDGSEDFTDITLHITVIGFITPTPETTVSSSSQDTISYVVVVVILSLVVLALAVYAAYLTLAMKRNAGKLDFAQKETAVKSNYQSLTFENVTHADVSKQYDIIQINNENRGSQKKEIITNQENNEAMIPGNIHTEDSKENSGKYEN